jgi:hypothetical protein
MEIIYRPATSEDLEDAERVVQEAISANYLPRDPGFV